MTHKDIYTKFMIEYDKANVTSSYPSLTEYEVATVLDKAYNALIAQKVTGNNIRRAGFESDLKSVTDLQPLIISKDIKTDPKYVGTIELIVDNTMSVKLPADFLYFVGCQILKKYGDSNTHAIDLDAVPGGPMRIMNVKLVSHEMADKFKATASNIPWVKNPVCYIENNRATIVYDSYNPPVLDTCNLTYIKCPNKFAKDLDSIKAADNNKEITYFYDDGVDDADKAKYNFECNDTVAEELISLAISFALENVESQRLNSKLNMRGLEA